MASTDRDALVALFRSTGGASWRRKENWDTAADVEAWFGVILNEQGRVVELKLAVNNLQGDGQLPIFALSRGLLEHPQELVDRNPRAPQDLWQQLCVLWNAFPSCLWFSNILTPGYEVFS